MTDDIHRMLAAACEDRPIHAPIDEIVRQGRRRVRRHRSGGTAFCMLAIGGVLAAIVSAWPAGGPSTGSDQGVDPAGPSVEQPGPARISDAEVIRRCLPLDQGYLWALTHDGDGAAVEDKAGGGTDPINDWSVVLTQAQDTWIRAFLLSPDEQRYVYCMRDERDPDRYLRRGELGLGDYNREGLEVSKPGFDAWVEARFSHGWSRGTLPDGVARLTFETPDGVVSDATIVDGFYLWYAERAGWGKEPVWATYYDADGNVIKRVNANPSLPSGSWGTVVER